MDQDNGTSCRAVIMTKEPNGDWEAVDGLTDLWASKEPCCNEFFAAEQTQSKVEVKFRTYYVPGVKNEMRAGRRRNPWHPVSHQR